MLELHPTTNNLSERELFVLVDEAKKQKIERVEIIHPNHTKFKLIR